MAAGCPLTCMDACSCPLCNTSGPIFSELKKTSPRYCGVSVCINPLLRRAANFNAENRPSEAVFEQALSSWRQLCGRANGVCNNGTCSEAYCTDSVDAPCEQTSGPSIQSQWLLSFYIVLSISLYTAASSAASSATSSPNDNDNYSSNPSGLKSVGSSSLSGPPSRLALTQLGVLVVSVCLTLLLPMFTISVDDVLVESEIPDATAQYTVTCYAYQGGRRLPSCFPMFWGQIPDPHVSHWYLALHTSLVSGSKSSFGIWL